MRCNGLDVFNLVVCFTLEMFTLAVRELLKWREYCFGIYLDIYFAEDNGRLLSN